MSKILVARNAAQSPAVREILNLAGGKVIPIELVEKNVLDDLSADYAHQGVIAYVAERETVALDDLFTISQEKNEPPLYCILDGIEDPQNLGAIIRTADAAGFHGIIIRSRRAAGLTPAVARASAGAIEYVPISVVPNIAQAVETLKKRNVWVTGIDRSGSVDYRDVDYKPPTAIVIGSEGGGLSDLVKKRCDFLASIPMRGKISSLNASIAAALVMYQAFRQRSQ